MAESAPGIDALPKSARLAFAEDWASGKIDLKKWYMLHRKWGGGNNGVVRGNVWIEKETVGGKTRNVLVCAAHGDRYKGPVIGWGGEKTRVGGVIVTKAFFISGRFETVMKVGSGPERPIGCVPALWPYGYRVVQAGSPLFNPHIQQDGASFFWSELDFPELGKQGDFSHGLYNTFCQDKHDPLVFDVSFAADDKYHTYTTDWRTQLVPLEGITDAQVVEAEGYFWIQDKSVPFDLYLGNPLKRLGKDQYALYAGLKSVHWIDGIKIGENEKFVPVMEAQFNMGVWLPGWGGPAPWETTQVRFASVRIWQYDDLGDVRGIITDDIPENMDEAGNAIAGRR